MRFLLALAAVMFLPCAAFALEGEITESAQARFKIVTVAEGLEHPWSLAFLPDGAYLVTERGGRMLRITSDGEKADVAGLPAVYADGQAGLFDVILDPDFKHERGYIYWAYAGGTDDANNTEVARGHYNSKANKLSDVKVIFRAKDKTDGSNHYGGRLAFGEDGALYLTLGDRFSHRNKAQDLRSHLGKTIRINPDGSVPEAGNPFRHRLGADPMIYTYGHRNVQGLAVQPGTGRLWAHEHGPRGGDEVNILKPGANYGWPLTSYGVNYTGTKVSDRTEMEGVENPVVYWTPSIAPSGMAFYTGRAFPNWRNDLFVGALAGTQLRRLEIEGDKVTGQEVLLEDLDARIRDVRGGPDGGLYLLTDDSDGVLLKLEPVL